MRYLSFDIECCDGKHICEFGYVITNENFEVLEKDCFTVNPQKPFNLACRGNRADCILFFSQETYYASPEFPEFYNRIKELISLPDIIIFGHAIKSDAIFLREACKRYNLPPLNFEFTDSQILYKEFAGIKGCISLENAEAALNLEKTQCHHKSDEDALLTIELVEKICQLLKVSVAELIALCPTACGRSYNFNIQYVGEDLQSMMNALDANPALLSEGRKKICIQKFSDKVVPHGRIKESCLNNKKLCFSRSFEKNNTKEVLKLIQILANHGCEYNTKVSENDYYVASDEELNMPSIENSRYCAALSNENGRKVKILSFDEFLSIVNLTPEALGKLKMPIVPMQKHEEESFFPTEQVPSDTVGDYLQAKGFDLSKLF